MVWNLKTFEFEHEVWGWDFLLERKNNQMLNNRKTFYWVAGPARWEGRCHNVMSYHVMSCIVEKVEGNLMDSGIKCGVRGVFNRIRVMPTSLQLQVHNTVVSWKWTPSLGTLAMLIALCPLVVATYLILIKCSQHGTEVVGPCHSSLLDPGPRTQDPAHRI
jgi:hypothetical protein